MNCPVATVRQEICGILVNLAVKRGKCRKSGVTGYRNMFIMYIFVSQVTLASLAVSCWVAVFTAAPPRRFYSVFTAASSLLFWMCVAGDA